MTQKNLSKFSLFSRIESRVEIDQIPLEEDRSHLPVSELGGIDEDEAQCSDRSFVLGVSFEHFCGLLNLLVIAGE